MILHFISCYGRFVQFFMEWPFEVLCFSLKYIEETYHAKFHQMIFADCMGVGMQAAVIASTFTFAETITIELSQTEALSTQKVLSESSFPLAHIDVRIGRVQVLPCIITMKCMLPISAGLFHCECGHHLSRLQYSWRFSG
jgi:hypothetical protein